MYNLNANGTGWSHSPVWIQQGLGAHHTWWVAVFYIQNVLPCSTLVCRMEDVSHIWVCALMLKWPFFLWPIQGWGQYWNKKITIKMLPILWSGVLYWCSWQRSTSRHCTTSRKVAGSIPDGVIGIFYWHSPSGCIVALGSTQLLTEMSTSDNLGG
jgi:hypothetical protein